MRVAAVLIAAWSAVISSSRGYFLVAVNAFVIMATCAVHVLMVLVTAIGAAGAGSSLQLRSAAAGPTAAAMCMFKVIMRSAWRMFKAMVMFMDMLHSELRLLLHVASWLVAAAAVHMLSSCCTSCCCCNCPTAAAAVFVFMLVLVLMVVLVVAAAAVLVWRLAAAVVHHHKCLLRLQFEDVFHCPSCALHTALL
jgi:hypothetical protein